MAEDKHTRTWTGRLLHQASFLAYSWERLPSPGPEVAAVRLLKGCHLGAEAAADDFAPTDGAWL
eukprot:13956283-Alexandrium_andersonii.AAC.1